MNATAFPAIGTRFDRNGKTYEVGRPPHLNRDGVPCVNVRLVKDDVTTNYNYNVKVRVITEALAAASR